MAGEVTAELMAELMATFSIAEKAINLFGAFAAA
jgi:hypothetical protein